MSGGRNKNEQSHRCPDLPPDWRRIPGFRKVHQISWRQAQGTWVWPNQGIAAWEVTLFSVHESMFMWSMSACQWVQCQWVHVHMNNSGGPAQVLGGTCELRGPGRYSHGHQPHWAGDTRPTWSSHHISFSLQQNISSSAILMCFNLNVQFLMVGYYRGISSYESCAKGHDLGWL